MKSKPNFYKDQKPFAHMFFFQLSDTSKELVDHFIGLCVKYLSDYAGQRHFSVGYRALEMNRPVNAKDFEIAVHMIFDTFESYVEYAKSDRHNEFITQSAGMSPERIIYDSFLHVSKSPVK